MDCDPDGPEEAGDKTPALLHLCFVSSRGRGIPVGGGEPTGNGELGILLRLLGHRNFRYFVLVSRPRGERVARISSAPQSQVDLVRADDVYCADSRIRHLVGLARSAKRRKPAAG